jgi:hypothetical protein
MARFTLITPVWGCPPSIPSGKKFGTGTTIADTAGNAKAGDIVWASFCASPSLLNCAPLDDAALSALSNLGIAGAVKVTDRLSMNPAAVLTLGGATLDAGD